MNSPTIQAIALRYQGIYISEWQHSTEPSYQSLAHTLICLRFINGCGYTLSEEVYRALLGASVAEREELMASFKEVYGLKLNWAALIRCWDDAVELTDEERFFAYLVNLFGISEKDKGYHLGCGHYIPSNTFPIERYTGCPLCGTALQTADYTHIGQGSKLRALRSYTLEDMQTMLSNLLGATAPLDATQAETLSGLLRHIPIQLPESIEIKETAIVVIDYLVEAGRAREAFAYIHSPQDILRYLWYRQTGLLQVIEPRTLARHRLKQAIASFYEPADFVVKKIERDIQEHLKLKYPRYLCRMLAEWLNALPQAPEVLAEQMHPKRAMWVRVIRALRLTEYARRQGFEPLAKLLDIFYKQDYPVYLGKVEQARTQGYIERLSSLLQQKPGIFVRQLFSTMLQFGAEPVLASFAEVAKALPSRLLLSLYNGAMVYFTDERTRWVKPITGRQRQIPTNKHLGKYDSEGLRAMQQSLREMLTKELYRRYSLMPRSKDITTVYIEPMLYNTPLPVGNRSSTVQSISYALPGTRFAVEGDALRLFLQWGKDLPAQHLDMDLSCRLCFADGATEECAYYSLNIKGANHSGDIQHIPDMVGTAEYIELDLPILEERGVRYVVFTCNAYTSGALSPNLMFGWMHSKYPMTISSEDGVAYDPSCVAQLCGVGEESLHKGLVFGVLDVERREVIWLEMPLEGQTLRSANTEAVEALIKTLEHKLRIGELLQLQAHAQGLRLVDQPEEADIHYSYEWALYSGEVYQQLLV